MAVCDEQFAYGETLGAGNLNEHAIAIGRGGKDGLRQQVIEVVQRLRIYTKDGKGRKSSASLKDGVRNSVNVSVRAFVQRHVLRGSSVGAVWPNAKQTPSSPL